MIVFCVILTLVCSLRASHMWLTRNHTFIRKIWEKLTSFIFWNFEILNSQNFKKVNSDRRIKPWFRRAWMSRAEHLWKACCTLQHGFRTASKMKRGSVDVIFLSKLEKFEKYFPVNWGIFIEYIHKHYIK